MKPITTKEKQRLSSKAPFVSAIVFFAIAWGQSSIFPESAGAEIDYFVIIATALYALLGVVALACGVYLQVKGVKTIDPPRSRHLVWSLAAVFVIAVIGIAVIYFQR